MPVNYATPSAEQLFPVAGVRLGVAEAEIRKKFNVTHYDAYFLARVGLPELPLPEQ